MLDPGPQSFGAVVLGDELTQLTLRSDSAEHYCRSLQRFAPELWNNLGDIWQFNDLLPQVGVVTTVILCMDPSQHLFQVEQVVVVVFAILVYLIFFYQNKKWSSSLKLLLS